MKPQHTHDCPDCTFVGKVGTADLYEQCRGGWLLRYSSDGPDYASHERGTVQEALVTAAMNSRTVFPDWTGR